MDKIDHLLDAIEHPENYSDSEIETLLQDPETREVYRILDKTKTSLQSQSSPDVDAEWETFRRRHHTKRFRISNLFSRNIAVGLAVGIMSLAAVAAVISISINHTPNHNMVTENENTDPANEATVYADSTYIEIPTASNPEIIVFNNEPLEIILNRIADYYGYKILFSENATKSLRLYFRLNQALSPEEVVESLNNFNQIHLSINDKTINID